MGIEGQHVRPDHYMQLGVECNTVEFATMGTRARYSRGLSNPTESIMTEHRDEHEDTRSPQFGSARTERLHFPLSTEVNRHEIGRHLSGRPSVDEY